MIDTNTAKIEMPLAFLNALSEADSVDAVMRTAAEWTPRMIPALRASCVLHSGNEILASSHWTDGRVDPISLQQKRHAIGMPRENVMRTKRPMILSGEEMARSRVSLFQQLSDEGLRSLLLAPMINGTEAIGVLSLSTPAPEAYTRKDGIALMVVGKCIAAQIRLMQEIRNAARRAETDPLTGLANRERLMRVLDGPGDLHAPDARGRLVGVLHIDLDHFKEVNDTLGHAAGDMVLRHAAQVMRDTVGPTDLVARVGGDEFAVVTRTDPAGRHLGLLAKRLTAGLSVPVLLDDIKVSIGGSIGTAIASAEHNTADLILGNADMALYEVKRRGRGGAHAFSEDLRLQHERRIRLMSDLQQAANAQQFDPHFQPQIAIDTGFFSGFEMLARWPHPELGLLDPAEFLSLVDEAGLAFQIDAIVRAKGLAALRALRTQGWDAPKMSFNASPATLGHPELVDILLDDVQAERLTPEDLVIEVRQKDLRALGREEVLRIISALSARGFRVDIDDFGAGLTSITTLSDVAVGGLKFDKSIVALLPDPRAAKIMRSVIALSHELAFSVTAEGVETPQQLQQLRALGCHFAQGYEISPPLALDELVRFMQSRDSGPVALNR